MGKRTEEKDTSKVAPAGGGGDCAKLLGGLRITRDWWEEGFLEISEKLLKKSNLAVWKLSRVFRDLNTQRQSESNLQKTKLDENCFLNWYRRERGGMGHLVYRNPCRSRIDVLRSRN